MRVVDVRDFCIPSDENDYDELVAFADTMANIPQFDAIPTAVLDKIRAEIAEYKDDKIIHAERNEMVEIVLDIIDKYNIERSEKE